MNRHNQTRESRTVIGCIVANGDIIVPYFIFKGSVHLERWYRLDNLLSDYRIAVSPKGYTNDQLGVDWLKHFDFCTRDRTKKGEKRHLTFEFLAFCHKNDIVPICFIAHSTHFTQPLDSNPFITYMDYFRSWNSDLAS